MENSRLVYSTETGRICPSCGNAADGCTCRKQKQKIEKRAAGVPHDGIVRIRREVKGRKGKQVTLISGVPLQEIDLLQFAKALKRRCGSGGSVKEGTIIIQGDHGETVLAEIKKAGYTVKFAGG